jgi:arginyl-tRNA--protein-N-Asp/Glu arginylyltransferase
MKNKDDLLTQNGFTRFGKSARILCKTPKAYVALVNLLATKFSIPRPQKAALDQFADIYAKRKQQVAYLKQKEATWHVQWVKDQTRKAPKGVIRPYPVVEEGRVYVYVNLETCPSAVKLKTLSVPTGCMKAHAVEPAYVLFEPSKAQLKRVLSALSVKRIIFDNEKEIDEEMDRIRG